MHETQFHQAKWLSKATSKSVFPGFFVVLLGWWNLPSSVLFSPWSMILQHQPAAFTVAQETRRHTWLDKPDSFQRGLKQWFLQLFSHRHPFTVRDLRQNSEFCWSMSQILLKLQCFWKVFSFSPLSLFHLFFYTAAIALSQNLTTFKFIFSTSSILTTPLW